jgi:SAM-dependent methyltransferase
VRWLGIFSHLLVSDILATETRTRSKKMAMSGLEKRFVNRREKGEANYERVRRRLHEIGPIDVRDVLEIGCGIGVVSANLARDEGWRVVGTDFDTAQIEAARGMYGTVAGVTFRVEDAAELAFDDGSFDLVVAQMVFHHMPRWPTAVTEIARVLRPGGHLMWLDLALPSWLVGLVRPMVRSYGLFTDEEVGAAFRSVGLVEVHSTYERNGPFRSHELVLRQPARAGDLAE